MAFCLQLFRLPLQEAAHVGFMSLKGRGGAPAAPAPRESSKGIPQVHKGGQVRGFQLKVNGGSSLFTFVLVMSSECQVKDNRLAQPKRGYFET